MGDLSKWDWADAASGAVMGVLGGVVSMFGWFNGKLGKVHDRIDRLHTAQEGHTTSIAVLQANGQAIAERLQRIEEGQATMNEKQDDQMKILMDLHGQGRFNQRGQ